MCRPYHSFSVIKDIVDTVYIVMILVFPASLFILAYMQKPNRFCYKTKADHISVFNHKKPQNTIKMCMNALGRKETFYTISYISKVKCIQRKCSRHEKKSIPHKRPSDFE
jgi:hypothetical protein